MRVWCLFGGLSATVLFLVLPVLADVSDSAPEGSIERIKREDPERYARLRRDLAAFRALSPERQKALHKLHDDLQTDPQNRPAHLEGVLDRYADWLDHLSEADRRSVLSLDNRTARLKRIHELRVKEWVARLPRAAAKQFDAAPPAERQRIWTEFFEERADWQVALRVGDASAKLSQNAEDYLEKRLRPMLLPEDARRLKDAEGKWPRFQRILVELADSHPSTVFTPTRIADLPPGLQEHFKELKDAKEPKELKELREFKRVRQHLARLEEREGKWPAFGQALHEWSSEVGLKKPGFPLVRNWLPSRPREFLPPVQKFIEKRLLPALDRDETELLSNAEGRWPQYPQTLVDLSRKHNLLIPVPLDYPGLPAREGWTGYRTRAPLPLE